MSINSFIFADDYVYVCPCDLYTIEKGSQDPSEFAIISTTHCCNYGKVKHMRRHIRNYAYD